MTSKIFHLDATFKAAQSEDGSITIEGMASTPDVDRVGDVILAEAWMKGGLDNYQKNPIILFNHQYGKPIGKATTIHAAPDGLYLKAKISKAAGEIMELIKDGVLGAFSVGFRIKDADYISETDGFKIKDAELFEVSVVSVPANQAAVFSLAKSFTNENEYQEFKKTYVTGQNATESVKIESGVTPGEATKVASKEINKMAELDIEALVASVAEKTAASIAAAQAEREKAAKAELEAKAQQEAEEARRAAAISVAVKTGTERLVEDMEKRFADKSSDLEKIVNDLKGEIAARSEEIVKLRDSKRNYTDRGTGDWKKDFQKDMDDAYVLGLATKKNFLETKFGKDLITKLNTNAGVVVSSDDFEQIVSTNIERDIQNELILAPLFREIAMNSASMILPILPDAGYAEFNSSQSTPSSGSFPKGNLDVRGNAYGSPYAGTPLTERILTTKKLISKSYIGNEVEEDAILPILPLIREQIIRSHARAVEASLLVGNHADGPFGVAGASYDGLIAIADADAKQSFMNVGGLVLANSVLKASDLLFARKSMGKYGVRADDVIYIVSQASYFELLEDVEFQDMNLVGNQATKITGQVGQVFGSRVVICDEFKAKSNSVFAAVAVNPRNFLRPRLRGLTLESDYDVELQRRVLVATQRLGFIDLIDASSAVWGLQYPAA